MGARAQPEGIEVMFAPAEEGGTAPAPHPTLGESIGMAEVAHGSCTDLPPARK